MAMTGVRALDELALDSTFLAEERRSLRTALRVIAAARLGQDAALSRRVANRRWRQQSDVLGDAEECRAEPGQRDRWRVRPVPRRCRLPQEGPVERISRDARFLVLGGGATEVMLDEVAGLL